MSQIEVKDLMSGSLVLDQNDRLIEVRDINGIGLVAGYTLIGERVVSDTDDLRPIPITANVLEWMGFTLIADYQDPKIKVQAKVICNGVHCYEISLYTLTDSWWLNPPSQLHIRGIKLSAIHHLQAVIWQLQRIWLTIDQKGGKPA